MKARTRISIAYCFGVALFGSCSTKPAEKMTASHYTEPYRPQYHFSPPSAWMNDPNGLVYYENEYHLFYQYYPDSTVWGPMHWGHAVSDDLTHWDHLPVALEPDSLGYIFSGSAVVDKNNTSGLGSSDNPAMIAIFTYHDPVKEKAGSNDFQTQGMAYSLDKGRTWTKYSHNPVLKNPGVRDFRDPKVFWYEEGKKWIMILAVSNHVELYESTDLKSWSKLSDFGIDHGAHGGVWECPDLFPLRVEETGEEKWIMLVSINPGSPNGGSGTQYFVGSFDGKNFQSSNSKETMLWLDHGRDNYAGITWSNIPGSDGRRLFIGWMSNWDYGQVVPTSTWRSAMTLPRTLQLRNTPQGLRLASSIVNEINHLMVNPHKIDKVEVQGELAINASAIQTGRYQLTVAIDTTKKNQEDFSIELSNGKNESLTILYKVSENVLYIDRQKAGSNRFSDKFYSNDRGLRVIQSYPSVLQLWVDHSSLELVMDEGLLVMTELFFPSEPFTSAKLLSKKLTVDSITVNEVKSIW
jgi:fructan beta-fructosidase